MLPQVTSVCHQARAVLFCLWILNCTGQCSQQRGQTQHTVIFGCWRAFVLSRAASLCFSWKLQMEMVRAAEPCPLLCLSPLGLCTWENSVCRQVLPRPGVGSVVRVGFGASAQKPLLPAPDLPSSRAGMCCQCRQWACAACLCLRVQGA